MLLRNVSALKLFLRTLHFQIFWSSISFFSKNSKNSHRDSFRNALLCISGNLFKNSFRKSFKMRFFFILQIFLSKFTLNSYTDSFKDSFGNFLLDFLRKISMGISCFHRKFSIGYCKNLSKRFWRNSFRKLDSFNNSSEIFRKTSKSYFRNASNLTF